MTQIQSIFCEEILYHFIMERDDGKLDFVFQKQMSTHMIQTFLRIGINSLNFPNVLWYN